VIAHGLDLNALAVPFSEEELALLTERAAAHGMAVIEFIRACTLYRLTPLEAPIGHAPGKGEGP
jgi:hypothetical protein